MSKTAVVTRDACRVCGRAALKVIIDYGRMPLAGGFVRPEEAPGSETFPLRLARCNECTLLQVLDTVPPETIFNKYSYASTTTRTLSDHFATMAPELLQSAGAVGKLVVEFGCNDGVLIRPLQHAGARVIGVDPSDVALSASLEQGWPLVHDYFTEATARRIREEYGSARLITANNVFAHMDDLHDVMRGVTSLLDDDGLFVFEVHYQGDLLALIQYDTVYHEHTCYHSLTSLSRLMTEHQLKIVSVRRIPIHAGSIRVMAVREGSHRTVSGDVTRMLASEKTWDVGRFVSQAETRRATLRTLVTDLRKAGRRVVAYGAAGRATILLNACGLGQDLVEYVVDMSPLRYGRLVPGVLTPIVPPDVFHDARPDYAIMTAWNYEDEIVAKEQQFLRDGGQFVVPLPDIRLVGPI